MSPLLQALAALGDSGSAEEISAHVISALRISEDAANLAHKTDGTDSRTELEYRLAWVRTTLKREGYLENSSRGIWSLTPKARELAPDFNVQIARHSEPNASKEEGNWRREMISLLIDRLSPAAFERLVQRVLRETGFS
ncbi:MAG: winged helix-turn-helix domain-containing protein, partial [Chthoniobacterales bacterium]